MNLEYQDPIPNSEKEPVPSARVVVMLGARMRKQNEDTEGNWVFPLISDKPEGKFGDLPVEVSGGDSRMRAIQVLYKEQQKKPKENLFLFITGGKEKSGHSRSGEAKNKLEKKYGVPPDIIKSLGSNTSTLGNAQTLFRHMEQNQQDFRDVKEIEIVTNDYHALRAWIMFSFEAYKFETGNDLTVKDEDIENIKNILEKSLTDPDCKQAREKVMEILMPYFEGLKFKIKPLIAEEIIDSMDDSGNPRFKGGKRYVEMIKNNHWVNETKRLENNGVIDFLTKKYKQFGH
jgi:hypothetical protein